MRGYMITHHVSSGGLGGLVDFVGNGTTETMRVWIGTRAPSGSIVPGGRYIPYGRTVSLGMAMPETGQRDSARQGGGRTEGQHGSCCKNRALACLAIHILDIRSISL